MHRELGLNPTSYHVVNTVLHSLVTLTLTQHFIRPLIHQPWIRCLTGLAFAVHPIHCEAVASVVGRAELGTALHILLALVAYRRYLTQRHGQDTSTAHIIESSDNRQTRIGRTSRWIANKINLTCRATIQNNATKETAVAVAKWKSRLYLTASLSAAVTAIFWKETGIMAVPLCAVLEFNSVFVKPPASAQVSLLISFMDQAQHIKNHSPISIIHRATLLRNGKKE